MGYSFLVDDVIVDDNEPYTIEVWADVDYEKGERGYEWTPPTPDYFSIINITFASDKDTESSEVEELLIALNEMPVQSKLVLYQIIFDVVNPYKKIKKDFKLKLEKDFKF